MADVEGRLRHVLQTHWGYREFRPLQLEAMRAVMSGRDSVVVLPTGGGKSLCFQAPALLMPGMAIVVSPLISLMKDQVDALTECGIPAAAIHSALAPSERQRIAEEIRTDRIKLLYVAPERLGNARTLGFLRERSISFIAIDEAHCISNWGHDFRPDYRMLGKLREHFPHVGIHGYTATATQQVQEDIAAQLQLGDPEFHIGSFDRANLQYRVVRRTSAMEQIQGVLQRHSGESGIIYCISRKEVDALTLALRAAGVKVGAYHAGLSDEERHRNQDAFLQEEIDVVVATVAFGMGIDKSNVRFVIHTGAPKSLEHYQQETGRAGRDGLDAECCLLYGGNDFLIWRKLNTQVTGEALRHMQANLEKMENYCVSVTCRHRALVEHFGQSYEAANCQACDVCLDPRESVSDPLIVSQKILSCVVRVNESFGGDYVAQVLVGSREQRLLDNRHDQLSTYGLLKDQRKSTVREWIEQLCSQSFLRREGEFRVLKVTPSGRAVLRGQQTPRLAQPDATAASQESTTKRGKTRRDFSAGMDAGLFEALRQLRRQLADERNVPPFVVFSDATLQDVARRRPTTHAAFQQVHGVGQHKAQQYGDPFIAEVSRYCAAKSVPVDVAITEAPRLVDGTSAPAAKSASRSAADALFREGRSLDEVMQQTGRARSTVSQYLCTFLAEEGISSPQPWVDADGFAAISAAIEAVGPERLKPIYDHLNGGFSYDQIRISLACWLNRNV